MSNNDVGLRFSKLHRIYSDCFLRVEQVWFFDKSSSNLFAKSQNVQRIMQLS